MKLFNIMVIPFSSANDFYLKFKKRMRLHTVFETAKLVFIVAIAVFILLGYIAPIAQKSLRIDFPFRIGQFLSFTKFGRDSSTKEVLNLASMIRLITDGQLSEAKVLRYAGLIFHASQKYGVDPQEVMKPWCQVLKCELTKDKWKWYHPLK